MRQNLYLCTRKCEPPAPSLRNFWITRRWRKWLAFSSTKVQILAHLLAQKYGYWRVISELREVEAGGSQFLVQNNRYCLLVLLVQKYKYWRIWRPWTQGGWERAWILRLYYSIYLLYWYKSTNTDVFGGPQGASTLPRMMSQVLSLLALLVLNLLALLVQEYRGLLHGRGWCRRYSVYLRY